MREATHANLRAEMLQGHAEIGEVRPEIGEVRAEIGEVRPEIGEVRAEVRSPEEGAKAAEGHDKVGQAAAKLAAKRVAVEPKIEKTHGARVFDAISSTARA